ncbi:MAG: hypothetical protein CMP43_02960 [Rickettsiales bacterium]|jgi:hypothetical protein|nr:hypothetical protein [Rickettsiales bacterium]
MKTLITILALFTAVAVYTDAKALQWQEKPVVCMVKEVLDAGLKERGEILISGGVQETTVREVDGLSTIPVWLPVSVYTNPITKTYTIVEYHPGYESYCLISYGQDWKIIGENL